MTFTEGTGLRCKSGGVELCSMDTGIQGILGCDISHKLRNACEIMRHHITEILLNGK